MSARDDIAKMFDIDPEELPTDEEIAEHHRLAAAERSEQRHIAQRMFHAIMDRFTEGHGLAP